MRLTPLPLARLGSLRISLDPALLFGLGYLGWWFFERYQALARLGLSALWPAGTWAMILTAGAFAGIVVHELGHVLGARLGAGRIYAITVSLVGGRMTVAGGRRAELAAAAGGPIAAMVLGALILAARHLAGTHTPDVPLALLDLARLHLLYGLLNLLPVPPLDGARLLDTSLARKVGICAAAALVLAALATSTLPLLFAAVYLYAGTDLPRAAPATASMLPVSAAQISTAPVSTSPV